ncbi:MAG: hypothetical protein U9Q07_15370 [Planctomycetota bacterium]|nr:hypothetical protein [Planctomycetota bacterium]
MESHNHLGIYISRDTATAVCLGSQGKGGKVLGCFSVSIEDQEEANTQTLASLLAQGCAERKLKFSEVAVALDCAMFMQHSVHSEFSDPKRIAATVKFDTEEALATDIADVALAFEIASSDEAGSDLTIFTAQRNVLSEVLDALQQYNLDPVTMEPDVGCLSRFICRTAGSAESTEGETLFAVLSGRSGYLVAPSTTAPEGARTASVVRTFLVGATQDRGKLLAREVLVTTAMVERAEPVRRLKVFDLAGDVDYRQLSEKLGIEADAIDLAEIAGIEPETVADCADSAGFAIAYGAALSHRQKVHSVNFRDDFSPFQGKKLRMQRAMKFAAVSITVLLIAAGVFFQTQLYAATRDGDGLRKRFAKDYSDVTLGKLSDGIKIKDAVRKLNDLKRRIEREKKGLVTDEKSVSAKLTLVLAAFNKSAARTDLKIKSLTVAPKTISITGDTSRKNTQTFFKSIRDGSLEITKESIVPKGGRDTFNIMVKPKE